MKKLSHKQKLHNIRRQRKRENIKVRRSRIVIHYSNLEHTISLPEHFSLRGNYANSIQCINQIREIVINRMERVFIDFSRVKYIGISCAMLMAAEIQRCRLLRPGRHHRTINGSYPQDFNVAHRLYLLNFFNWIGIPEVDKFDHLVDHEGGITLKMNGVNRVETAYIKEFTRACLLAFSGLSQKASRRMQGAMTEAVENALDHAFTQSADFQTHGRRAWVAGYVHTKKCEATLMVLDQGAGIPRTLPQSFTESIGGLLPNVDHSSDSARILAATKLGRSGTNKSGRGQGFRSMKAFVDICDDAELVVMSNSGYYIYSSKGREDIMEQEGSIGGTIVMLRIRHQNTELKTSEVAA